MQNKLKGRILSAVSAAALAVTAMGSLPAALPTNAEGLTGLDAKGITSRMIIGWNLGNTLDCGNTGLSATVAPKKFATAWGNPEPTAEQVQAIKDGGFNTIRIPTTWYEHLTWDKDSQMYVVNEQWMDYVKQTVDYAYERDMFVILNIHHEDFINVKQFTDDTYKDAAQKMKDIWTQVAEEFKDYDQHLIFEGMNEPRQTANPSVQEWGDGSGDDGYSWSYINNLNKLFVDTVRGNGSAANKERLLMLPGYVASSSETAIRHIEIPAGAGNVALSVHAYAPYFFTMATDSKANHQFPGASGWGEDYEGNLSSLFNMLDQVQKDKGAPIIIGEFSASDFGNTEDRIRWAQSYLSKAKAAGIPCVLWDNNVIGVNNGEAHGYLYRKNGTWYDCSKPVVQAMMDVYGVQAVLPDYVEVTEPKFDFNNLPIGENWVELYKNEQGELVDVWDNFVVPGWQDYINERYDLVMFYEAKNAPELVLQGEGKDSWHRIESSDDSGTPFTKVFTFDDVKEALTDESLSDMKNLYISATRSKLTAYGLYAVPKEGIPQPVTVGDVDSDGTVDVRDIIALQKYLLAVPEAKIDSDQADMNGDAVIDIFDLGILKRRVLVG